MNLNDENIELYLFQYKEGMLDAGEAAEVERAIAEHPEWKEMADLYDPDFRLPAGATMPYDDFESLRDGGPRVEAGKPIKLGEAVRLRSIPIWKTVGVAASLLLFVTIFVKFFNNVTPELGTFIAEHKDSDSGIIKEELEESNDEVFVETVTSPVVRTNSTNDEVLLAEAVMETPADIVDDNAAPALEEEMAKALDTNKYQIKNSTTRELNDPMDQEVLYANIINWKADDPEPSEAPTRRQQLRSIARKATSIIATAASGYEENRENIEDAIEERIQSNPFVNNLIATIE